MSTSIIFGVIGGLALIVFCLAMLVMWLAARTPVDRDEDAEEAELWVRQAVAASEPAQLEPRHIRAHKTWGAVE